MKKSFILLGALFGFLLSRAGATDFDLIAKLFLLEDLQLLWVICSAIAVGTIGIAIMKSLHARSVTDHNLIDFKPKPAVNGMIVGGLIFGIGWGITGTCPGTAPTMLGEGKMMGLFSILGIAAGTYLYGWLQSRKA